MKSLLIRIACGFLYLMLEISPSFGQSVTYTAPSTVDLTKALTKSINVANGLAGLDANGSISQQTVDAAGNTLSSVISDCTLDGTTVFYGAENSGSDMGVVENTKNLRATGNTNPYFNILTLDAMAYGSNGAQNQELGSIGIDATNKVLDVTGRDIIAEDFVGPYITPHIASSQWYNFKDSAGNVIDNVDLYNKLNLKPKIMMMNTPITEGASSTDLWTDDDVATYETVVSDVKSKLPSVQYVWPYTGASASRPDWATDSYYDKVRAEILKVGGMGLDIPAGLYVLNGRTYITGVINTIKWANANNVRTVVLLSPYGIGENVPYTSVTPQWRRDSNFLAHVKTVIAWLKENDALPSAWAVVSYSPLQWYSASDGTLASTKDSTHTVEVTANTMGSDTDSANQTVAYVARWVAENAPTSYTVKLPNTLFNQGTTRACPQTVLAGQKANKISLGSQTLGLGSLAYMDSNAAHLTYPNINGAEVNGNLNFINSTALVFGANATPYESLAHNSTTNALDLNGTLHVNGTASANTAYVNNGNLILNNSNQIIDSPSGSIYFRDSSSSTNRDFVITRHSDNSLSLSNIIQIFNSNTSSNNIVIFNADIGMAANIRVPSTNAIIFGLDGTTPNTLQSDGNGTLTANGTFSTDSLVSKGVFTAGPSLPANTVQGLYINWNKYTNSSGETDLINMRGSGPGGFAFYNKDPRSEISTADKPLILINSNGTITSSGSVPMTSTTTLTTITSASSTSYTEGTKLWCHDCRAPSQATGTGTGRWIYKDSQGTWRSEDGLEASN